MRIFGFILAILFLSNCQKGEEDPSISLISRKTRLSGTWDLVEMTAITNDIVQEFSEGKFTITTGDTTSFSFEFNQSYIFDRNGDYEINSELIFEADTSIGREAFTRNEIFEGQWEFTGGNGEPKKSQLILMQTRMEISESDQGSNVFITTVDNPSKGQVYSILKLSSDELKLTQSETTAFGGGSAINEQTLFFRKRS